MLGVSLLPIMRRSKPSTHRMQVEAEEDHRLEVDEVVDLEIETNNRILKIRIMQVEETSLEAGGAKEAVVDGKGTSKQIVAWNANIVENQGIWQGAAIRNRTT